MGWANCGKDSRGRNIGYAIEARCDHLGCDVRINRGLANACGGMHGNSTLGGMDGFDWCATFPSCEGYFCEGHLRGPSFEHEDGTEFGGWPPSYCPKCADEHERSYALDPDFRELWPTDAPIVDPPTAQGTSASGQDPKGLEAKPAGPVVADDAPVKD